MAASLSEPIVLARYDDRVTECLRSRLILVLVLAASVCLACGSPGRPPDVIFITVDTLRTDRLGVAGHALAKTTVIDELAASGTFFPQATTPFPRTTPGLASLMTGLWPHHHGSREVGQPMDPPVTLAEILAGAGYATLGFSANRVAGALEGFERGFERLTVEHGMVADDATSVALQLARSVDPQRPLFLWVHYIDPHFPYLPPGHVVDPSAAPLCRELGSSLLQQGGIAGLIHSDFEGRSSAALEQCLSLYDGEISFVDSALGTLLRQLREMGRLDHAILVFTSDHGENLGEGGLYYEHGPDVLDASLRVPLIFRGEGIAAGRVDRGVARLEDVVPTVLALLGLEPIQADGTDLSPRLLRDLRSDVVEQPVAVAESGFPLNFELSGAPISGRPGGIRCVNGERFSLCDFPGGRRGLYDREHDPHYERDVRERHPDVVRKLERAAVLWPGTTARQRTARDTRFKLIEYPRLEGGYRRVLYDLQADPGETRDVADEHPEVLRRLASLLAAAEIPAAEEFVLSEEQLEALRALGYTR
jgi:arylsulfatase A-like enzyme